MTAAGGAPRRRRYVSVAAGTYAPPVRPRAADAAPRARLAPLEPEPFAEDDVVVPSPAATIAMARPFAAAAATRDEALPPVAPVRAPAPEPVVEPAPNGFGDVLDAGMAARETEPTDLTGADFGTPRIGQRASWAQFPLRRILVSGTIGAAVGLLVGWLMLALAQPDARLGLMEPGQLWGTANSQMRLMVVLFALAFGVLGVAADAFWRMKRADTRR